MGIDEPSNKGMKLTKLGQLRSFAAYPQCHADVSIGESLGYVAQSLSFVNAPTTWTER